MNNEIISKYFPSLTERQKEQFAALDALYRDWNSKINVISRKDIENLYLHHVLHSLAIARVCRFNAGARVVDVGCGGGFPSVPLAILFPEVEFVACDSIGKKIIVVANLKPATLCGIESQGMILASGEDTVRVVFLAEDTPLGERIR